MAKIEFVHEELKVFTRNKKAAFATIKGYDRRKR